MAYARLWDFPPYRHTPSHLRYAHVVALTLAAHMEKSLLRHGHERHPNRGSERVSLGRAQKQLFRLCGGERVAELGRFLLSVLQRALTATCVILRSHDVIVWNSVLEHVLHGAGAPVRRSYQGVGGVTPPLQAPVQGPKRTG